MVVVKIGLEFNIYYMKNIKNFEQFNEGFFSKIKKAFTPTKKFSTIYQKYLNIYKLSTKMYDSEQEIDILDEHKKLVGKIKLNPEEEKFKWILTFYYYDSEVSKDQNKYKQPEKIEGQEEQPYATGQMKFNGVDIAIRYFCRWWGSKTKSGIANNPEYKVRKK
jgi:hypothetical protein